MTIQTIPLYVPPPTTAETGAAYTRLALGVAEHVPGLLNSYFGPEAWREAVLADLPSLEQLRHHAIAVATAAQKSELGRNRRERILRNVRALLWLIRKAMGEQLIFSEQVRFLIDLKAESASEALFEAAHEALSEMLPRASLLMRLRGKKLDKRWVEWQAAYTLPATEVQPLLIDVLARLAEWLRTKHALPTEPIRVVLIEGDGDPSYAEGELRLPEQASLRVDRLYHLAARLGYGGADSLYRASKQRYAAGEAECAVLLNLGIAQVIVEGLHQALLSELALYKTAIPELLEAAALPAIEPEQLQAIHTAEDALQWSQANAALLLYSENLRARAVRRHLMSNALMTRQQADKVLQELADPVRAAHIFAPLIGAPLIKAWLTQSKSSLSTLLTDPPVPSTMLLEVRFGA